MCPNPFRNPWQKCDIFILCVIASTLVYFILGFMGVPTFLALNIAAIFLCCLGITSVVCKIYLCNPTQVMPY